MWSLNLERVLALVPGGLGSIAIESGTCRGNGTRALGKCFDRVISIELSAELHELARARLASDFPHVELLHGSSAQVLNSVLPSINAPRLFFFLDAHWSGDESVDWGQSTWKGYGLNTAHLGEGPPRAEDQSPLAEELRAIMKHCAGSAVVLIDDMKNLPAEGPGRKNSTFAGEDWSHLSRELLLKIVAPRLKVVHALENPEQWLLVLRPMV